MDKLSVFTLLLASLLTCYVESARILVNPFNMGHNSRLRNMILMAEILEEEGHEVTLMSNSMVAHLDVHRRSPRVSHVVHYDNDVSVVFDIMSDEVKDTMANLESPLNFVRYLRWVGPGIQAVCDTLLSNQHVMTTLKESNFDLIIFDICQLCGIVLKQYLGIPAITWSNYGPSYYRTAFYPENPSFMCPSDGFSCYSDVMDLHGRFHNFLHLMVRNNFGMPEYLAGYDALKLKHNISVTATLESEFYRILVFAMMDFSSEFPRPLPANVIPIPYLFRQKSKPLPERIANFLNLNPGKGIVYLGFGTLVDKFPIEKANIIASTFAKFDENVFIWRNNGTVPKSLHDNTLMLDWVPQLDVLGSNRTKLFITHCGISSMYETIQSGVPFIASPLFWDQKRNAAKMIQRAQSGILFDYNSMTEESLYEAIKEILDNYPQYKAKAERAAELANSHAVAPREQLLWWVDYTIRTKGAKHLMSEVVPQLYYVQYLMLDVIILVLLMFLCVVLSGLATKHLLRGAISSIWNKTL